MSRHNNVSIFERFKSQTIRQRLQVFRLLNKNHGNMIQDFLLQICTMSAFPLVHLTLALTKVAAPQKTRNINQNLQLLMFIMMLGLMLDVNHTFYVFSDQKIKCSFSFRHCIGYAQINFVLLFQICTFSEEKNNYTAVCTPPGCIKTRSQLFFLA